MEDVVETGLRLPSFLISSGKAPGSPDRRPLSEGLCALSRDPLEGGDWCTFLSSCVSPRLLNRLTANRLRSF